MIVGIRTDRARITVCAVAPTDPSTSRRALPDVRPQARIARALRVRPQQVPLQPARSPPRPPPPPRGRPLDCLTAPLPLLARPARLLFTPRRRAQPPRDHRRADPDST